MATRRQRPRRLSAMAAALTILVPAVRASAQAPELRSHVVKQGPVFKSRRIVAVGPCSTCIQEPRTPGIFGRAVHHVGFTIHDQLIGYPQYFAEPPMGAYVYEASSLQRSRADAHQFYLYRTDFIDGENNLSPYGAQKLSLMTTRLSCWPGPVVIEWVPEEPALAYARRTLISNLLTSARVPITADRIVVGPSPYPGLPGFDAQPIYNNLISRDTRASNGFQTPPSISTGGGGGGGVGGGNSGGP